MGRPKLEHQIDRKAYGHGASTSVYLPPELVKRAKRKYLLESGAHNNTTSALLYALLVNYVEGRINLGEIE